MGAELLGEGPVAVPAVTRSVAVELERAPPEVTRSVPVELERAPPEVTRSGPQWLRQPPGGEDSQAAHLQTRAVAASWPKASQTARRVGPASAPAPRAGSAVDLTALNRVVARPGRWLAPLMDWRPTDPPVW